MKFMASLTVVRFYLYQLPAIPFCEYPWSSVFKNTVDSSHVCRFIPRVLGRCFIVSLLSYIYNSCHIDTDWYLIHFKGLSTPLLTIFQLYLNDQLYCWRKREYPEKKHWSAVSHGQILSYNVVTKMKGKKKKRLFISRTPICVCKR
jgi:hypothetical protein